MTLKARKGFKMLKYQQAQLIKTLEELITEDHILFQLQWLTESVKQDNKEIEEFEDLVADRDEMITEQQGTITSLQLTLEIEVKWRKELEEKSQAQSAEITKMNQRHEASIKRYKSIIEELKGADKDRGGERRKPGPKPGSRRKLKPKGDEK